MHNDRAPQPAIISQARRCTTFALLALLSCMTAGCGGGDTGPSAAASNIKVADTRADGTKMTDEDRTAANMLRNRIAEHWVKTADGWTTEFQNLDMYGDPAEGTPELLYRQLKNISFTMEPAAITDAQKQSGADYRAAARFDATAERSYRAAEFSPAKRAGPPGPISPPANPSSSNVATANGPSAKTPCSTAKSPTQWQSRRGNSLFYILVDASPRSGIIAADPALNHQAVRKRSPTTSKTKR